MGVVYMIFCLTTGEVYYGSTKRWVLRKHNHRCLKGHQSVAKQIIERGNYEFIILEQVDDDQLLIRERYYIDTFPCVNQIRPFRTNEEQKTDQQKRTKSRSIS